MLNTEKPLPVADSTVMERSYRSAARWLHWSMAVMIAIIVPLGLYCASLRGLPGRAAERDSLLLVHKSLGLAVLALAVVRLVYRWRHAAPPLPQHLPAREQRLATVVHVALYALLLLAPLSGILLSQGAGQPVSFFGLLDLPQLVPIDRSVPAAARPQVAAGVLLHKEVFKYLLWGVLALHLLGVAKHAWVDRDPRMLGRMWPRH